MSSWMIEREFADRVGPFTDIPLLAGLEDWDFLLRALWLRPLVFVPEVLTRYRIRPDSITRRRTERWRGRFEIYRQAEARAQLPPTLRRRCHSTAWWTRAEEELEAAAPGWRRSFLRAFSLNPTNWRRWPGLIALILPRREMQRAYRAMKAIQNRHGARRERAIRPDGGVR